MSQLGLFNNKVIIHDGEQLIIISEAFRDISKYPIRLITLKHKHQPDYCHLLIVFNGNLAKLQVIEKKLALNLSHEIFFNYYPPHLLIDTLNLIPP